MENIMPEGFDILIWANEKGHIFGSPQTILGEAILHGLIPTHKRGKRVEIKTEPSEFFKEVPRKTRIGLVHPTTKKVVLVALGGLH
jgi:hypothetical protein